MESRRDAIPKNCYQCGTPTFPITITDDTAESGWFCCDGCGERIISTADLAEIIADEEERVIRRKLGVDEFSTARRINNDVADK